MRTWLGQQLFSKFSLQGEIQGLRAIAVLSVVGYHAGLPLSSGYLGVDYFFVISGYVISGVLFKELKATNRINLWEFYKRRFFRLIPALATMVFITSILSFFLISPLGMQQNAAKTGIGSLLLSANKVISKLSQGYFDLPAQTNPFLHTWSLSVEEQFYVVFPILMLLLSLTMKGKGRIFGYTVIIGGTFAFSFIFFHFHDNFSIFTENSWLQGFYSPIGRVWEFLLGVAVQALSMKSRFNHKLIFNSCTKYLTIILITLSVFLPEAFFRNSTLLISIPLLGICILLWLSSKTDANRFLSHKKIQFVGDRSYSIYLWHWPFIVFSNYLFPGSKLMLIVFLLSSFFIAIITYKYIENPIRLIRKRNLKNLLKISVTFVLPAILTSGLLGYVSSEVLFKKYELGQISGFYQGDIGAIGFDNFSKSNVSRCSLQGPLALRKIHKCDIDVLIVGDSHAQHLLPGFIANNPGSNFGSFGMELFSIKQSANGRAILDEVIKNEKIKVVIISAFWHKNGVSPDLTFLIRSLSNANKRTIILDDVPNFPFDAFTCKFGFSQFIKKNNCSFNASEFAHQRNIYFPKLAESVKGVEKAELLVVSSEYCSIITCSMVKDGKLHFLDMNHLNINGSMHIADFITANSEAFANIGKSGETLEVFKALGGNM